MRQAWTSAAQGCGARSRVRQSRSSSTLPSPQDRNQRAPGQAGVGQGENGDDGPGIDRQRPVDAREDRRDRQAVPGVAGGGKALPGRQARTAAMRLAFVPGQPLRGHDAGHRGGQRLAGIGGGRAATGRPPCAIVLRPKPVQHEAKPAAGIAFRVLRRRAGFQASGQRRGQRQAARVEIPRRLAIGPGGGAGKADCQRPKTCLHFRFPSRPDCAIRPPTSPRKRESRGSGRSRFPGTGEICKGVIRCPNR